MSNPIPKWPEKWPATPKGFNAFINLTTPGQPVAVPINENADLNDPNTLFVLNIGTTKTGAGTPSETINYKGHARMTFLKSAGKNLFAVPVDVLCRIAKVVTFYHIIFGDSKKSFSQRAVSWLADVGRILAFPFTWPIIVATELFAWANPSAFSRNAVVKLENMLLENDNLDYLQPTTLDDINQFAIYLGISPKKNGDMQVTLTGGNSANTQVTTIEQPKVDQPQASKPTVKNPTIDDAEPVKTMGSPRAHPLVVGDIDTLTAMGFRLFCKPQLPPESSVTNPSSNSTQSNTSSTSISSP